jgi:hypothetical protein
MHTGVAKKASGKVLGKLNDTSKKTVKDAIEFYVIS